MSGIIRALNRVIDITNTVLFNVLCAVVLWQVICRYILNFSSPWTEEIARYLLVTVTFVGAAIATRDDTHLVAVDPFRRAPHQIAAAGKIVLATVTVILFAIMFDASLDLVEIGKTETTTSMLWLKMSHIYSVIPISFGLIIFYSISNIIKIIRNNSSKKNTENGSINS